MDVRRPPSTNAGPGTGVSAFVENNEHRGLGHAKGRKAVGGRCSWSRWTGYSRQGQDPALMPDFSLVPRQPGQVAQS